MKVTILIIFLFAFDLLFGQLNQNFDVGNFLPLGWSEYHSGVNALKDTNGRANSLTKSALFDDESGVDTSCMIMSQITNFGRQFAVLMMPMATVI